MSPDSGLLAWSSEQLFLYIHNNNHLIKYTVHYNIIYWVYYTVKKLEVQVFSVGWGIQRLKFDKTAVHFLYYMGHMMFQNMESRNHMVQGSWAAWDPGRQPWQVTSLSLSVRRAVLRVGHAHCSRLPAVHFQPPAVAQLHRNGPRATRQSSGRHCVPRLGREGGREWEREGEPLPNPLKALISFSAF